jgi:hypothetical protein
LHGHFTNATITWYHAQPADLGLPAIGHNGFFLKREADILWKKLDNWLNEQVVSPNSLGVV